MNVHLVLTKDEQMAVVNALAFYHSCFATRIDEDEIKQFRMAFAEESVDVDSLSYKIAGAN